MYYENKKVFSGTQPLTLEITPTAVYVREYIQQVKEEIEDKEILSFEYLESKYDKDTYLKMLAEENAEMKDSTSSLGQQLSKEKIETLQKTQMISSLGQSIADLKMEVLQLKNEQRGGDSDEF